MSRAIDLRKKAVTAKRESKNVDFKETFDPSSKRDWCEIVKDIVAMANSGGGVIIIGVKDKGKLSGVDVTPFLGLDPATITDKTAKYTGEQFADFEIIGIHRDGNLVAAFIISGVPFPMIFTSPGTYDIGGGKQKTAFSKGTVYFRHGAKSEPGTSKDLRDSLNRELVRVRRNWLGGIRKVVTAPTGHSIKVLPPEVRLNDSPSATAIHLVNDEGAPAFKAIRTDKLYPHRQKEVIAKLKERLPGVTISSHSILCVRKAYDVESNPTFFYKPQFSSPQYSDAFVDWVIDQYQKNPEFFEHAKQALRKASKQTLANKS
jgi:hypothetical protein